jgi:hypothetical protein
MSSKIQDLDEATVREITDEWPEKPRNLADELMEKYGMPGEITMERLIWHDPGDWKRTMVYRDGTPHNFPKEHVDHLRQTIDYPIDPADCDDLIAFDGSNVLYRTRGEMAADCHTESMNFLTINLAHHIVTGEKTVEEARRAFAETAIKAEMGMQPELTQGFTFEIPSGDQSDPDASNITDTMKKDVKQALDKVTGGDEEE